MITSGFFPPHSAFKPHKWPDQNAEESWVGLLMVSTRHIHVNRFGFIPDLWWFSYTPEAGQLFRGLARRFASGSVFQTLLVLPQMIRRWFEP